MPGKPGRYLPGVPCHVIQRGNNRGATFLAEQAYLVRTAQILSIAASACNQSSVGLTVLYDLPSEM